MNMQLIEDARKVAHEKWPMSTNFRMRLATWIASHAPRGRGAIPRFVGRYFGASMKTSIRTNSGAYLAVEPSSLDVITSEDGDQTPDPEKVELTPLIFVPYGRCSNRVPI